MKTVLKRSLIVVILSIILFCLVGAFKVNSESTARYSGYGDAVPYAFTTTKETITYTKREVTYIETYKSVPKYMPISELSNSCGATAGAIVVGFYDRYYEELIPNYVTYVSAGTYKGNDTVYIPQLMRDLYTLMRTNVDDVGVSETDCKNGLASYVANHGRSIQYSSVLSSKKINETLYRNAINNNNLTLLFCSKMDLINFSVTSNSDTLVCNTYSGGHVAVAYGLFVVDYYNGNSIFRTDKYLRIATAMNTTMTGYLKIDSTDWCNAAYAVAIN